MTEQHGLSGRKYEFLEQLPIEDLEYFLRLSSDSVETEEFLDAVTEVIINRERDCPTGRIMNVGKAWHEFQTVYNTPESEGRSPLPEDVSKQDNRDASRPKNHTAPAGSSFRRLGRSIVIVATIIALVFSTMIGAQAAGLDIFGTLARWTDSTFHHITTPRERDESIGLQNTLYGPIDVEELLGAYAPAQLPDNAVATASSIKEDEFGVAVQVSFSLPDDKKFFIQLDQYRENSYIDMKTFERDTDFREKYLSHSRAYYILSNEDYYMATWSDSTTMITILGDLSADELKLILDSIGG